MDLDKIIKDRKDLLAKLDAQNKIASQAVESLKKSLTETLRDLRVFGYTDKQIASEFLELPRSGRKSNNSDNNSDTLPLSL